jgi:beta-lactam-binding protein with PASTA domain
MAKSTRLEDMLLEMLADPVAIAGQSDLAQAVTLERQSLSFRQRAGAAALRLRRARVEGADPEEIAQLEATLHARVARLDTALLQASAANVKRPVPQKGSAQVFARATGKVDKPPLTLAAIDENGAVLAAQAANEAGIAHLVTKGDLDRVTLQISDCNQSIVYRSADPVTVAAGSVYYLDAEIGTPAPAPCPVPTTVKMPDLIGQGGAVAKTLLLRLGIDTVTIEDQTSAGPPDIVLGQDPAQGTVVDDKTSVTLTLSTQSPGSPDQLYMPGVVGDPVSLAQERLQSLGLETEISLRQAQGPAGIVLVQSPDEGAAVAPGALVFLTVSQAIDAGPTTIVVPDLISKSRAVALEILKAMGLRPDINESRDPKAPSGVIAHEPPGGTSVAPDSVVKLEINTPPKPDIALVRVPNLLIRSISNAREIVSKLGLVAQVSERADVRPKGQVIEQVPGADERVAPQSTVALVVSAGQTKTPGDTADLTRLSRAMAVDPRAENVLGDAERIERMLRAGSVDSLDAARALAGLEAQEVRDRMGIGKLKAAATFRAVLRKSLKEMG